MAIPKPHLAFAHKLFRETLKPGDRVIDATCGRGHDSTLLAQLVLTDTSGELFCLDIQEEALASTKKRLEETLLPEQLSRVTFVQGCHSRLPTQKAVDLIVYNLGYLPLGNKSHTTEVATTLESVKQGLTLLEEGGNLCITCYPGHEEGEREESALLQFVQKLPSHLWLVSHTRFLNRIKSPSVLLIKRADSSLQATP